MNSTSIRTWGEWDLHGLNRGKEERGGGGVKPPPFQLCYTRCSELILHLLVKQLANPHRILKLGLEILSITFAKMYKV